MAFAREPATSDGQSAIHSLQGALLAEFGFADLNSSLNHRRGFARLWCCRLPEPACTRARAAGNSWWETFRSSLSLLKIKTLVGFRKACLVQGTVWWHSLEVLNVFVCLTDRKPSGEAPVPSRPVSPPHFFLTGSDACSPCCGHPVIRCFSFSVSTSDITKAQTPFITMATMTVREEKHK